MNISLLIKVYMLNPNYESILEDRVFGVDLSSHEGSDLINETLVLKNKPKGAPLFFPPYEQ